MSYHTIDQYQYYHKYIKLFEKIIKTRLNVFLTKNYILSDSQYGFREVISSSDALMDLTECISESLERLENLQFYQLT